MYPRLTVVVAFFSPPLAATLLPGLGSLSVIAGGLAFREWRKLRPSAAEALAIPAANPLQLTTALAFAGLFLVVSLATSWVEGTFGQTGILALAALVGASDIDPFVLSLAQGGAPGIAAPAAAGAVLIAASANNLAKAGYAIGFGGLTAAARSAALLGVATRLTVCWLSLPFREDHATYITAAAPPSRASASTRGCNRRCHPIRREGDLGHRLMRPPSLDLDQLVQLANGRE